MSLQFTGMVNESGEIDMSLCVGTIPETVRLKPDQADRLMDIIEEMVRDVTTGGKRNG